MVKKRAFIYECEKCGKKAKHNVQTEWHDYDITADDDFIETNSWDGDENHFYCDKCYEKEMSITNLT